LPGSPYQHLRLASPGESRPRPPKEPAHPLLPAVIMLVVCAIRLLTRAKHLLHPISFAIASGSVSYNPALLSPPPPGSPALVGLVKLILLIHPDPCLAIELISAAASAVACAYLFLFANRLTNTTLALTVTSALAFNPLFWFYGANPLPYTLLSAFVLAVVYHLWLALERHTLHFPLACLIAGVGGAFCLDILWFLLPLLVWIAFLLRREVKYLLAGILLCLIIPLAGLLLATAASGGLSAFVHASRQTFLSQLSAYSAVFGKESAFNLLLKLTCWTLVGATIPLLALFFLPVSAAKRRVAAKNGFLLPFFLLWVIPALAFFILVYILDAGYLLAILPALYLLTALLWHRRGIKGLTVHIFMVLAVLLGAGFFMGAAPQKLKGRTLAENLDELRLNRLFLQFSYGEITGKDRAIYGLTEMLASRQYQDYLILVDRRDSDQSFSLLQILRWYGPENAMVAGFSYNHNPEQAILQMLDEKQTVQEYKAEEFPLPPRLLGKYLVISELPGAYENIFDLREIIILNDFLYIYRVETEYDLPTLLHALQER
jgi:hypothetical protein